MKFYISPSPVNPASRLLATFAAALSLIGFFFFGLIVAGVLLAALLVFGFVFWVRSWWMGRKSVAPVTSPGTSVSQGHVIDAEYSVVRRRRE